MGLILAFRPEAASNLPEMYGAIAVRGATSKISEYRPHEHNANVHSDQSISQVLESESQAPDIR